MWDYTKVGTIMIAIYMLYSLFIGYPLGLKIWGGREESHDAAEPVDPRANDVVILEPEEKRKIIIMLLIFSFMVLSFVIGYLSVGMTSMATAMLCVVLRCTDEASIVKNMNWSVIFFLAGCLGIASGITDAGVGNLIADGVVQFFGKEITPWQLFVVLVPLTMLISNFVTNSTAVMIVLPVAISICQKFGYNCRPFGIAIVYAASLACSTPLAHAQITMTLVAGYKFFDYLKYTIILAILTLVSILVFVPIFFPLV
jgi:di/tricarboxylate transporter